VNNENPTPEQSRTDLLDVHHIRYIAVAFGFSWIIWIGAWILGRTMGVEALFNEEFVWRVLFERDVSADVLIVSLVSLVAVFGPMIGGIYASRRDPTIPKGALAGSVRRVGVGRLNYLIMLAALALVVIPALLISIVAVDRTADGPTLGQLGPFLIVFFVVQLFTSGTEEIGWRGYLVEKYLPGRDFWEAGWNIGFVWAAWHVPVVVMIFAQQGMLPVQIVGSLAGFAMGTVAMSIFHTWFYGRTGSVFFNVVIHAAFNTLPLTIVLLFEGSPAALVSNLTLWVGLIYLRKREKSHA